MGQQLLDDLVAEEVRRARAPRRDRRRRRRCSRPMPRPLPYQLMLVPRRPRLRFEDDGPTGAALLHDALTRLARRFGGEPAAQPLDAHRPARRRAVLLADRHRPAAAAASPASSSAAACTSTASRPSRPPPSCASSDVRALRPARLARRRPRRRRDDRADRARASLVLLGVAPRGRRRGRRPARREASARCASSPTPTGQMNEPLGDARGPLRQPVHALRRHPPRQPPELRRRRAAASEAEPLYERFCERLGAARGRFGAHMEVELVGDGPVTILLEVT